MAGNPGSFTDRTYHVLGVPFRTGSLYPGSEKPGHVPLLIGCHCSIVVGTADVLRRETGTDIHVLYVDGDFDDAPPDAGRCQSAAALAVWLLTNASPFWTGPALRPSQVTVIGWSSGSQSGRPGIGSVSLRDVRRAGARQAARQVLATIPAGAPILVHFDIDVLRKSDMPAAYFPHDDGLGLSEASELLTELLQDARIRLIELAEYASLRTSIIAGPERSSACSPRR